MCGSFGHTKMLRFGSISLLWALSPTVFFQCRVFDIFAFALADSNTKLSADNVAMQEETDPLPAPAGPTWSVYEVLEDESVYNISQSLSYVKDIPVHTYWDVHRGGFRTGVIGEKIIETFPQFVTYSLIKNGTKDSRGPISLINVTTIDTSTLFMHLFLVVKHMADKAANTLLTAQSLHTQLSEFDKKLTIWRKLTGEDWKTAAQLRTECSVKEIQIEMLGKRIGMSQLRSEKRLAAVREYFQNKTTLLEEFHRFSLQAKDGLNERVSAAEAAIEKEKMALMESAEEERLTAELQFLNLTYEQTIDKLRQEINISIATLFFKAEEESRAAHENEDVTRNILVAQAENMRRNFEEIFLLLKTQLSNVLHTALSSPLLVLKWALLFSLLLSLSVLSTELYAILRLLILRSLTSPLVIRESKRGSPTLPSAAANAAAKEDSIPLPKPSKDSSESSKVTPLEEMILPSAARESFHHLSRLFVMRETALQSYPSAINLHRSSVSSGSSSRLCLPNLLIIGPPGSGKSLAAVALAHSSGLPYLTLCGGDILGASPTLSSPSAAPSSVHSGGSGGLLRDVLDSAEAANNRKGYLVILDEADALIAKAKRAPPLPLGESSELSGRREERGEEIVAVADCLHILLHRLRVNSPSLGTIITSTADIHLIDSALLDRMDHVIHLDLPSPFHRLCALLHYSSLYLSPHLSPLQEETLQRIHFLTADTDTQSEGRITFAQSAEDLVASLERIFKRKIDVSCRGQPSPTTPLSAKKLPQGSGSGGGGNGSGKKKTKKNSALKSGEPPVDVTPSVDSNSGDASPEERDGQGDLSSDEAGTSTGIGAAADVLWCLSVSLLQSEGWSYREIEKFVKGILSAVLSTERCLVTSRIWSDHLRYKKAHIHVSGRQAPGHMPSQTFSTFLPNDPPPQGSPST